MIQIIKYKIIIKKEYAELLYRVYLFGFIPIEKWKTLGLPFKSTKTLYKKLKYHNIKNFKIELSKKIPKAKIFEEPIDQL